MAESSQTPSSMRIAAIDVGSNSIHMAIAQVDANDAITTLWRMKEMVGLGRQSFPSHYLSKHAIETAIVTLARFKAEAEARHCEKIITVATSAVREASNGGLLIERARNELSLPIKIVSAREEARLIYLAVRHDMQLKHQPHLICDIGGGSVELVVGDETQAALLESFKLGAARVTAKFVHSDPVSESERHAIRKHYRAELERTLEKIESLKPTRFIGTSGTIENIAAMCNDGQAGEFIDRDDFSRVFEKVLLSRSAERDQFKGLDEKRKDQIVAGMILIDELFARLKFKRIYLCKAALREGIVLDYLSRHIPDLKFRKEIPDPRRRSVLDLARKCGWHRTHSEHVTRLCLRLFDDLRPIHKLGAKERELIEYGTLLHDIGWHIAPDDHHKHSAYLIENGKLADFTKDEIGTIAAIARYHRKSPPRKKHRRYAALSSAGRKIVDVGSALLRIADGLDRSHASIVQDIRARVGRKKILASLSVKADAALEIWAAQRKSAWLEQVLKRKLKFAVTKEV